MKTKICGGKYGCGEEKPLSEFQFSNKSKGTYQVECKDCRNKIRRDATKQRTDEYNKKNGIVSGINKKCSICNKVKSTKYFPKTSRNKDGLRECCKECHNKKNREYINKNIDAHRKRSRDHKKQWHYKNKDKANAYTRNYFKKHPSYRLEYERKRRKEPKFRMKQNLRRRVRYTISYESKKGSAIRELGCSVKFLTSYLESKFYPHPNTGEIMSWGNYGLRGWHIDHIIPLSYFDLEDVEQFKIAVNYRNLQPMWADENLQKAAAVPNDVNKILNQIRKEI